MLKNTDGDNSPHQCVLSRRRSSFFLYYADACFVDRVLCLQRLLNVFSALHKLSCSLATTLDPPAAPSTPPSTPGSEQRRGGDGDGAGAADGTAGSDGGDGDGDGDGDGGNDPLKDVDPALVTQLGEMGFPANRAGKALVITGGDVGAAMEWLLMHSDDPDIDEPLAVPPPGPASPGGT